MCKENCSCSCTKVLKLEVGKTYINGIGDKIKIIYLDNGTFLGAQKVPLYDAPRYDSTGRRIGTKANSRSLDLTEEYIIPVVHKKDVVLFKDTRGLADAREFKLLPEGYGTGEWPYLKEISRKTVTFTE